MPSDRHKQSLQDVTAVRECRHGRIRYLRGDSFVGRSLELYGEFSEAEAALLARLLSPGDVVVEAGANVGALTIPMAKAVGPTGRIIAYEPQRLVAEILRDNLAVNELANVEVRHAALGAEAGTIAVPPVNYHGGGNFGGVALGGPAGEDVPLETVDGLALDRVDLIKVDVEGMEPEVLAGAAAAIRRHRPLLYLENDRSDRSRRLIEAVQGFGYRAYWHLPSLFNPDNHDARADNVFGKTVSVNLVGVPAERSVPTDDLRLVTDPGEDWRPTVTRAKRLTVKAHPPRRPSVDERLKHAKRALEENRLDDAEVMLRAIAKVDPANPELWFAKACLLVKSGRRDQAEQALRRVILVRPDHPLAHNNLAVILRQSGRLAESIYHYRSAIALKPDYPDAHKNLGMALLTLGEWQEGWRHYEWRERCADGRANARELAAPRWDGAPLDGRAILLHGEQGLGDTIQFARYAPLVAALGGRVALEVPRALHRLMAGLPGVDRLIVPGEDPGAIDAHLPLLSLPFALGISPDTVPADTPYLFAEPQLVAAWRRRLVGPGRKIGLVWAGSARHGNDANRSIAVEMLRPLLNVPQTAWYSLQVGGRADQVAALGIDDIVDLSPVLTDFAATAAAIAALDLVVTVDTSVAHLAGALGRPVWTLLPTPADWRWMTDGEATPWYPTMRLCRQRQPGDWPEVIDRLAADLAAGPAVPAVSAPGPVCPVCGGPTDSAAEHRQCDGCGFEKRNESSASPPTGLAATALAANRADLLARLLGDQIGALALGVLDDSADLTQAVAERCGIEVACLHTAADDDSDRAAAFDLIAAFIDDAGGDPHRPFAAAARYIGERGAVLVGAVTGPAPVAGIRTLASPGGSGHSERSLGLCAAAAGLELRPIGRGTGLFLGYRRLPAFAAGLVEPEVEDPSARRETMTVDINVARGRMTARRMG